jgi:hypothetical protein
MAAAMTFLSDFISALTPYIPFLAALTAILIFIATQLIALIIGIYQRVSERRTTIIGLHEEVSLNFHDLDDFLKGNPNPPRAMLRRLRDRNYRPHIIGEHSTRFFEGNIERLPRIDRGLLKKLLDFYKDLEGLHAEIRAIQWDSFRYLHDRPKAIRGIWLAMKTAHKSCGHVKRYMERKYKYVRATR